MSQVSEETFLPEEYVALSELRYRIRLFLEFSAKTAARLGIEPRQHQVLLALKALSQAGEPTVRDIAGRLLLRHHSVVGLLDRMEARGLVRRTRSEGDRRAVCVALTSKGESLLRQLSVDHRKELQTAGPSLVRALEAVLAGRAAQPTPHVHSIDQF